MSFLVPERKWHDGVVRVLVCDQSALFRRQVVLALEATDDLEVVGEAPDGETARRIGRQHAPDAVVLGAHLPPAGGLAAAAALLDASPGLQLVFVYDPDDERDEREIRRAFRVGALAVIRRGAAEQQVAPAVRAVVIGRPVLDAAAAGLLLADLRQLSRRQDTAPTPLAVDPRVEDVLTLLATGRSTVEVAAQLDLAPTTASNLVANALLQLQRWTRQVVRAGRTGASSSTR